MLAARVLQAWQRAGACQPQEARQLVLGILSCEPTAAFHTVTASGTDLEVLYPYTAPRAPCQPHTVCSAREALTSTGSACQGSSFSTGATGNKPCSSQASKPSHPHTAAAKSVVSAHQQAAVQALPPIPRIANAERSRGNAFRAGDGAYAFAAQQLRLQWLASHQYSRLVTRPLQAHSQQAAQARQLHSAVKLLAQPESLSELVAEQAQQAQRAQHEPSSALEADPEGLPAQTPVHNEALTSSIKAADQAEAVACAPEVPDGSAPAGNAADDTTEAQSMEADVVEPDSLVALQPDQPQAGPHAAQLYGGPGRAAQGEAQQQGVPEEGPRLLQVAVVGVPNAGKSTLTNALVGQKVSAVSSKTNTTFVPTLGAFTEGPTQVVLYDTPGVVGKRQIRGLDHEQRVRSAWGTAADCDELLFIIDAHRQVVWPDTRVTTLIQQLSTDPMPDWQCPPATLVLNKVDLLMKDGRAQELAPLCDQLRSLHPFGHVFAISALRRDGIDALRDYLVSRATPGEWTIEAGKKTEQTPQETVTEVVREKVFRRLHEELPYNIGIQHESWRNFADGSARVEQTIVVPTDQVRRIVVGKHGAVIGQIGKSARLELTDILKQPIHLILNVKVRR